MLPDSEKFSWQELFTAPVEAKRHLAEQLHVRYGSDFLQNENLSAELAMLKEHALLLSIHMTEMGMGKLCIRCAAGNGGGCCSLYMAGETDAVQLLMNMLAGVTVRQVRTDGMECCYLGAEGCRFIFKPMFCLNYNCRNIQDGFPPDTIRVLERLTGRLLAKQHEMEKRLLNLIGSRIKG